MEFPARKLLAKGAEELNIGLSQLELDRFSTYARLLQFWGKKMNLTSRLSDRDIVLYHFLDSLTAYSILVESERASMVDVGAGAGFPALPLKICLPDVRAVLVESSGKKVAFCREVVRKLDLSETLVLQGRGEEVGREQEHRGQYDWAVVRAVGQAGTMAEMCHPFLRTGGSLVLYKGSLEKEELHDMHEVSSRLGATYEIRKVAVPFLQDIRHLIIIRRCSTWNMYKTH